MPRGGLGWVTLWLLGHEQAFLFAATLASVADLPTEATRRTIDLVCLMDELVAVAKIRLALWFLSAHSLDLRKGHLLQLRLLLRQFVQSLIGRRSIQTCLRELLFLMLRRWARL